MEPTVEGLFLGFQNICSRDTSCPVSFQSQNPDPILKNPDFLSLRILISYVEKTADFIIKQTKLCELILLRRDDCKKVSER